MAIHTHVRQDLDFRIHRITADFGVGHLGHRVDPGPEPVSIADLILPVTVGAHAVDRAPPDLPGIFGRPVHLGFGIDLLDPLIQVAPAAAHDGVGITVAVVVDGHRAGTWTAPSRRWR